MSESASIVSTMSGADLPEGWALVSIGDVTRDVPSIKPEDQPEREFRYIDISAICNRTNRVTETRKFLGKDAPSRARRPIRPGDILFSNVRTYLRNIAKLETGLGADVCSTGFTILRANEAVDPAYLFYAVLTDDFIDSVSETQTGTHYPATSDRQVRAARIALPPRDEQTRIVRQIAELTARVDASRERLAKVPAILKHFRQAVLAAACSGRLTADWNGISDGEDILPASWRVEALRSIAEIRGGIQKQPRRSPQKNAFPYLRVANVLRGRLDLSVVHEMELFEGELSGYRLSPLDLLIVEGNGSLSEIGRSALWTGEIPDCVHQNHIIRVRITQADPTYVGYYWNSPLGCEAASGGAVTSAGLHSLSVRKIAEMTVPLPPLEEQQEIVRRVDSLFKIADVIERRVSEATARADKLTQSILARAFRGELVPTEAELARREGRDYEPASALLERIRSGHAKPTQGDLFPNPPRRGRRKKA